MPSDTAHKDTRCFHQNIDILFRSSVWQSRTLQSPCERASWATNPLDSSPSLQGNRAKEKKKASGRDKMVRIGEQRNRKSGTRAVPSSFRVSSTLAPLFRVALASDLQGIQRGETRSDIPHGQPVIYNSGNPIVDVLMGHSLHPQPELSYLFDLSTIRNTRSGYHDRKL